MANIKARVVVLKTDTFIDLGDGNGPCSRVTPEALKKIARENGWAVEPIPGVIGGLQVMVEINLFIPVSTPNSFSIESVHG